MLLRRMVREDIGQVATLEQKSYSPWTSAQIKTELDHNDGIQFVAVDNAGEVVGWCSSRIVVGEAELLKIAVHPKKRRFGIGKLLLTTLEKDLINYDTVTIYLEVRSQNIGAIHLYSSCGFSQVGIRLGYYSQPADDALIFSKGLSPQ